MTGVQTCALPIFRLEADTLSPLINNLYEVLDKEDGVIKNAPQFFCICQFAPHLPSFFIVQTCTFQDGSKFILTIVFKELFAEL